MSPEEYFPIDEEQWAKSGSKFAKANLDLEGKQVGIAPGHLSVMGMPSWRKPGVSYQFPFVIEEEGEDNGKESALFTGMVRFSLEPIFKACGVPFEFKDKKLVFDKMAFVGKKFLSVWQEQVDSRTPEEGGKGLKYTKPVSALPIGAKVEDIF